MKDFKECLTDLIEERGEEEAVAYVIATALQCRRYAPDALCLDWVPFVGDWVTKAWYDVEFTSYCNLLWELPAPRKRIINFLKKRYVLALKEA